MIEPPEDFPTPKVDDVGPDPVWGVGLFVTGLLVMATGGAATWHWVFISGAGVMLAGGTLFVLSVALTWWRQRNHAQAQLAELRDKKKAARASKNATTEGSKPAATHPDGAAEA